jgi:hypothetical protein
MFQPPNAKAFATDVAVLHHAIDLAINVAAVVFVGFTCVEQVYAIFR